MNRRKVFGKKKTVKQRGFTLMELMIAVALGVMVLALGTQLIFSSSKGSVFAAREKELQDANRIFLEKTNNSVKYATAVFTVPEKTFNAENNAKLSKNWNYLGIKKNVSVPATMTESGQEMVAETALVDLKYVGSGDTQPSVTLNQDQTLLTVAKEGGEKLYFVQTIIAFSEKRNGMEYRYDIVFSKPTPKNNGDETPSEEDKDSGAGFLSSREGKGLNYSLSVKGLKDNGEAPTEIDYGTVLSKITALNSLQVVDKGTPDNPAVAIAYRSDNIVKDKGGAYGVVSMVVDTSGSMDWDIAGNKTYDSSLKRITILKKNAKELLKQFAATKNTDVMIVPFASTVKMTGSDFPRFYSASTDHEDLNGQVDSLSAYGGTNTGDALRYAFYKMGERNQTMKRDYKDYLIILVDGASSASIITNPKIDRWYYYGYQYNLKSFDFLDNNQFLDESHFLNSQIYTNAPCLLVTDSAGYTSIRSNYGSVPANNHYEHGKQYVTHIAKNLYDKPYDKITHHESAQAIDKMIKDGNVFLIGFSQDSSDGGALEKIAKDFHIDVHAAGDKKRYFEANSESELSVALNGIGAAIAKDLWMVNGPEL